MSSKSIELVGGGGRAFDLTIMEPRRWGMNSATLWFRDPAEEGMNLMRAPHEVPAWIPPFPDEKHHASWRLNLTHPDARLIACAPELLAALEKAHAELANSPGDIWSPEGARNHEERQELIRKARGVKPTELKP
jgi:hypothetical protein